MRQIKFSNMNPIGLRDFVWASYAVLYRIGLNALPVNIHFRLAALRGYLHRRIFGIPSHVIDNVTAAFEQLDPMEVCGIARCHVEFSQETNMERILPLLYRFRESQEWRIEGENYLKDILLRGNGALLITAHFGYARLIEPVLKFGGYAAVRLVAEAPRGGLNRSQRWEQWVQKRGPLAKRFAEAFLLDFLRYDNIPAQLDIRPILRALGQNKLVVVAADGLVSTTFLKLKFLDQEYPFATGYIKIAALTGAPIIPVFARRDAHQIVIEVLHPIEIQKRSC